MIRVRRITVKKRVWVMQSSVRARFPATVDAFDAPDEDFVPLTWSIPAWLVLAAASWAGLYFVLSLVF
jgi:hypothetical protein